MTESLVAQARHDPDPGCRRVAAMIAGAAAGADEACPFADIDLAEAWRIGADIRRRHAANAVRSAAAAPAAAGYVHRSAPRD